MIQQLAVWFRGEAVGLRGRRYRSERQSLRELLGWWDISWPYWVSGKEEGVLSRKLRSRLMVQSVNRCGL